MCGLLIEPGEIEPSLFAKFFGTVKNNKSIAILALIAAGVATYIVRMPKPKPLDNELASVREEATEAEKVPSPNPTLWKPTAFDNELLWSDAKPQPMQVPREPLIAFGERPVRFAAVGGTVYDVSTGRPVVRHNTKSAVKTAVSASGLYFAQLANVNGRQAIALHRNAPDAGRPKKIAEFPARTRIGLFRFAGDKLLVQQRRIAGSLVMVYEPNGTLATSFEVSSFNPRSCAVSRDGRVMVVAGPFAVELLELETGNSLGRLMQVETGYPSSSCNGLAFSPDDRTVAGLLHRDHLVVWSTATGSVLLEHRLPKIVTTPVTEIGSLQWLPDGRGWLLNDRYIFTADPFMTVWEAPKSSQHAVLVDRDHLLLCEATNALTTLRPYAIPWTRIDEGITTLGDTLIESGMDICLSLNLSRVENDLAEQIEKAIRYRCKELGFNERNKARVHLVSSVIEAEGTSRAINREELVDENGDAIEMTEIACRFQLRDTISSRILWEVDLKTDGGVQLLESSSKQKGRTRAIEAMLTRIRMLNLPTQIIDDPKYRFPIQASFDKDQMR